MRRLLVFLLLLPALAACDEPNDACTEEGKSKHYSAGKILTCRDGKWVMENGHGFVR